MLLIGAGFGRTGTKSLKTALEILGYGPCYHMIEVLEQQKNPDHLRIWDEAGQGKPVDWTRLFQNYQATVDWPGAAFYQQLLDVFPSAKVLLSVRDPQRWYESAIATIFRPRPINSLDDETFQRMVTNIILTGTFQGRFSDRDYAISVFVRHIEQVKRVVPSEQLLVYDVRSGWEPLCHFLHVPLPNLSFPKENSTQEWQEKFGIPEI